MKTFQDSDPLFGVMMNAIANLWPNGTAVLSECAPTGSAAARQVTVAAGSVVINGTVRSVSQQTKTLDAATFDRYDLISVNASGTVVMTKGTEERRVPALPANSVPIAICLIETGQTTLPADRIYDTRMDALRLSVLNIDANKDWNGKNITNVGALDTFTGNVGARSLFVDVPGDTVRKTVTTSVALVSGAATAVITTITVPPSYSSEDDSNARIVITTSGQAGTTNWSASFEVLRGESVIGSGSMNYLNGGACTINTTGGFVAGSVLTIRGLYSRGSDMNPASITAVEVQVKSTRSTVITAKKVFVEAGAW